MANSERLLISSILNESSFDIAIKRGIAPEMFRGYEDEWIFLQEFYDEYGRTPARDTFQRKFPRTLVDNVVDTEHFADEVKEEHIQFLLTNTIKDAASLIADKDVNGALKLIHAETMRVASKMGMVTDTDIFDSQDELYIDIQERINRYEIYGSSGIPTGFPSIDEATGGLNPGELVVIAARLGEGKSWLMQRFAASAAIHGNVVQFNALEQTRSQVNIRILSMLSGKIGESIFSSSDLMQGKNIDLSAWKKYLKEARDLIPGKLHVADTRSGPLNFTTLGGQIERNKPDIVLIDYLTLMQKPSANWQDVVGLSNGCKLIGMKHQIPVVVAAQLNRAEGIKRDRDDMPGTEALAYSDAIGHDADIVLTMKKMSERVLCMYMAKNRNGYAGFKVWVRFQPDKGRFEEIDGSQAEDLIYEDRERERLS